jgi:penicillin-binding protein 1C
LLLLKKRDFLLNKLYQEKKLSENDWKLSLSEPLPQEPEKMPQHAVHLLNTLASTDKNKHKSLYESTVDKNLQYKLEKSLQAHYEVLKQKGIHNMAALILDNDKATVLAYAGNIMSTKKLDQGESIDIIRRPRSTGSLLKPFLYLAMLKDSEILPNTLIPDIPIQYNGYIPENFDRSYRGAVQAKQALSRSLNIPAVIMLKKYGLYRFYDYIRKAGLSTVNRGPDDYGLTIILGGAEGTLWELSQLYGNLARLAKGLDSRIYQVLKSEKPRIVPGLGKGQGAAYLTLEALLEVSRPEQEAFWQSFTGTKKIAWKTGTSFGFKDGWSIGTTPHYTVAVWTGNHDGEGKPDLTGFHAAAPFMFDIFNFLEHKDWFTPPYHDLKQVDSCRESGYIATQGCPQEKVLVPYYSNFADISPYHHYVHLDKKRKYQVHSGCEKLDDITHELWFSLPAAMEFYYRKHHPEYKNMPPLRIDCQTGIIGEQKVIDIIYPNLDTVLYIPIGLDGLPQAVIFKAYHKKNNSTLFWHLDENYLGTTRHFHEKVLQPEPGEHTLTLVDDEGNRTFRKFKVLMKD